MARWIIDSYDSPVLNIPPITSHIIENEIWKKNNSTRRGMWKEILKMTFLNLHTK